MECWCVSLPVYFLYDEFWVRNGSRVGGESGGERNGEEEEEEGEERERECRRCHLVSGK